MVEAPRKRRQGELLRGVFELLKDHPEGVPAKEVLTKLRGTVPPTPTKAIRIPESPRGCSLRQNRSVRHIPFVKAGWLVKTKGQWSATEEGLKAFGQYAHEPEGFMREAIKRYRQWKKDQPEPADDLPQASEEAAGRRNS
jgi:restriction system protein